MMTMEALKPNSITSINTALVGRLKNLTRLAEAGDVTDLAVVYLCKNEPSFYKDFSNAKKLQIIAMLELLKHDLLEGYEAEVLL